MARTRPTIPFLFRTATALALGTLAAVGTAQAKAEWLSLCGKCLSPTVVKSSGLGTEHAVAEARITPEGARGWCENWQPDHVASCMKDALASDDARITYHAAADCVHGRITTIDGSTYTLAGVWNNGIGRGRTKWRDSSGHVMDTNGPTSGLTVSQQWEVLCPGASTQRASTGTVQHYSYAVGQQIEARYGRDWVRGRITRIWPHEGGRGMEPGYDVQLSNGKRGIVPSSMLRAVPPG